MKRPFPKHYLFFLDLAHSLGLDCPEGRALCMVNRVRNCDALPPDYFERHPNMRHHQSGHGEFQEKQIRSFQTETAERWLKHWKRGGSIQALSRSHEQELANRRFAYHDKKERMKRWQK